MKRETITYTTPSGQNTLVLNSYITGREKRAINAIYLKEAGDLSALEITTKGLRGSIIEAVQALTIKSIVESINDKKDGDIQPDNSRFNLMDYLLDLRSSEYENILKKINTIMVDAENAEKKTI